jgi:hypothetical protein
MPGIACPPPTLRFGKIDGSAGTWHVKLLARPMLVKQLSDVTGIGTVLKKSSTFPQDLASPTIIGSLLRGGSQ